MAASKQLMYEISKAKNGFIVRAPYSLAHGASQPSEEWMVFETLDALLDFIRSEYE